jgi:hypothetical protein
LKSNSKSPIQLKTKTLKLREKVINVEMVLNKEGWEGKDQGGRLLVAHEYSLHTRKTSFFTKVVYELHDDVQ